MQGSKGPFCICIFFKQSLGKFPSIPLVLMQISAESVGNLTYKEEIPVWNLVSVLDRMLIFFF